MCVRHKSTIVTGVGAGAGIGEGIGATLTLRSFLDEIMQNMRRLE
jgi:hypothetical protein